MERNSSRREFLRHSTSAAIALSLGALPACTTNRSPAKKPWFQISLAEWSLHRALFSKQIDHLDFARLSKQDYGIDAVEYVNQFFMNKAQDRTYLKEMLKRSEDFGVKNVLIMIDGVGQIGDPDPGKRRTAIENHYPWVEAAKFLGCHAIRLNAYSSGTFDEQLERCADGLSQVVNFATPLKMNVLVENHGQQSSDGKWVAALMRKVHRSNCGTLPDFGNFEKSQDKYQAVADMMPWAKGVSGKSHDFDANGNETTIDYRRMLKIVKDSGYRGYVEAEYEGERLSEPDGIRATKRLLETVRDELA